MAAQAEPDVKTRTPVAALAQLAKWLIDAQMLGVQRTAFDGMRAASGVYFEAATNAHRRLLAIAEGGKP